MRFEHCYALDQSGVAPEARKDCWRQWLHGYTYGQPRDRVEYAAARFGQLSLGPSLPNEEAPGARPRHAPAVATPVPTNAFAPPPNLAASASVPVSSSSQGASAAATAAASAGPAAPVREAALRAPGADCSDGCAQRWTSCREGCRAHACDDCDSSYRLCMPACFNDDGASRQAPRSLR